LLARGSQRSLIRVFEFEEGREGGGLLIISLAMLLCYTQFSTSVSTSSSSPSSDTTTKNSSQQQKQNQHQRHFGSVLSLISLLIGILAIVGAVWLPQYYNSIGVPLPKHCGGKSSEL
jgi:hypothetical protein